MTAGPRCRCLLCKIEEQLLYQLQFSISQYEALISSSTNGLATFPSPSRLLSHLKATQADASADDIYRELFLARPDNPQFVEPLLILAFVPVLHGTIRRVAKLQTHLFRADITQQALTNFLSILRSDSMRKRQSYFVFAISRSLKRNLFEWAGKDGSVYAPGKHEELPVSSLRLLEDDFMERHALLRHFLHHCVRHRLLNDAELDLLIQMKLDGNTGEEIAESTSITSNAVRQRMKRLLAKLRTLAAGR